MVAARAAPLAMAAILVSGRASLPNTDAALVLILLVVGVGQARPDHRYRAPITTTRTPITRRIRRSGSRDWIRAPV